MAAPLLRLVNSGVQDNRLLHLKDNPDVSIFNKVFIRAGRFTTQWIRLDFDNNPRFNNTCVLTIPRKGHLITQLYLVTSLPDIKTAQTSAINVVGSNNFAGPYFGYTNSVGHALIREASIEIGGSRVERLDGRLLEVLNEYYSPLEKQISMNSMLLRKDNGFTYKTYGINGLTNNVAVTPLPFWFSSGDAGLALPIDAIQADQVKLSVTINDINSLYVSSAQLSKPSTNPAGGDCYFPIVNSPFYMNDSSGIEVNGLNGIPGVSTNVSLIPNIRMPSDLQLGDTYIMAEYVYLDKPEANRFRISDIKVPIVQHYPFDAYDTQGLSKINFQLKVPNPTRNLFFYLNHYDAIRYNAPFLATRDLSSVDIPIAPWWPDASGLEDPQNLGIVRSGFSTRDNEPLQSIQLVYEGKLMRFNTDAPSLFRSILPSYEMRKSPWINRYYYTLLYGFQNGLLPISQPSSEANLDKILNIELNLTLHPNTGSINPNNVNRFFLYVWAETYNILRVYGGRAGLLFAY